MDYTTQSLAFKIKKTLRYIRLYGVRRTLVKIKGQYHMKKRYKTLPKLSRDERAGGHVGLIGCGNFPFAVVAYYLRKNYGRTIRGAMDIDIHRAASLYEAYRVAYYTDQGSTIINDPQIDLVYVASNHASHAEYAIKALEQGKCVHIEKPHVVTHDQLVRLCKAMRESKGKVALGFVRPRSIRDKVEIILKKTGEPLHFMEIANRIREANFDHKNVTVQAVHNELIRYPEFVLVGRGLYALKEWGYEPGTVADVIERILQEKGPLSKKEIIAEVAKQRTVKVGTISLNLQKMPYFKRVGRAVYAFESSAK